MNFTKKASAAAATVAFLATGAVSAQVLNDGFDDGSNNTSVFISVVERNATNQIVRNLLIDSGVRAADILDLNPAGSFATTAGQAAEILEFIESSTGTVLFNVGGALNDRSFATPDRYGFLTTGFGTGPSDGNFGLLSGATVNIDTVIGSARPGVFSENGVLKATQPGNPGWHGFSWGNNINGTIAGTNEVRFGEASIIQGWRWDGQTAAINNLLLGTITSDLTTGMITFTVVPVPAAVWLFASALGLLGFARRRRAVAA